MAFPEYLYLYLCTDTITTTYLHVDIITKTPKYFDPLKPHFYIIKWGLQGYKLFFLFLLKVIDCGYSSEPPRRGGSNEYRKPMF